MGIHIGGAPLYYHSLLAVWSLGMAALEKAYWEDSQKLDGVGI